MSGTREGYKTVWVDETCHDKPQCYWTNPSYYSDTRVYWRVGETSTMNEPWTPLSVGSNGLHFSTKVKCSVAGFNHAQNWNIFSVHRCSVPDDEPIAHGCVSKRLTLGEPVSGMFFVSCSRMMTLNNGRLHADVKASVKVFEVLRGESWLLPSRVTGNSMEWHDEGHIVLYVKWRDDGEYGRPDLRNDRVYHGDDIYEGDDGLDVVALQRSSFEALCAVRRSREDKLHGRFLRLVAFAGSNGIKWTSLLTLRRHECSLIGAEMAALFQPFRVSPHLTKLRQWEPRLCRLWTAVTALMSHHERLLTFAVLWCALHFRFPHAKPSDLLALLDPVLTRRDHFSFELYLKGEK